MIICHFGRDTVIFLLFWLFWLFVLLVIWYAFIEAFLLLGSPWPLLQD